MSQHNKNEIEIHTYEGATVASGVYIVPVEYRRVILRMTSQLKELARWVEKRGDIIGHIKAYIKRCDSGLLLSITDFNEDIRVSHNHDDHTEINMAIIVYQIKPDLLQTRLSNVINTIKNIDQDPSQPDRVRIRDLKIFYTRHPARGSDGFDGVFKIVSVCIIVTPFEHGHEQMKVIILGGGS